MDSNEVQTTVVLELEGKLVHAVTDKPFSEIQDAMQAERLIQLDLDGDKIYVQAGSIEYLREGDHRPQRRDEAGPPA